MPSRLATALLLVALAAGVYLLAVQTAHGQLLDASSYGGIDVFGTHGHAVQTAASRARRVLPVALALAAVALAVGALLRGRLTDVLRAVVLVLAAFGIAELLKDVLPRPAGSGIPANTLPSGHAALTAALAVAGWWLLPPAHARSGRPVVATVAAAGAYASYLSFAHRPSDVVTGVLLAAAVAVMVAPGPPRALGSRPDLPTWSGVAALAALSAILAVLADHSPWAGWEALWPAAAAAAASWALLLAPPRTRPG